jgi:hypothetical protein
MVGKKEWVVGSMHLAQYFIWNPPEYPLTPGLEQYTQGESMHS